jgi:peptidoglycan/LPS O-acetylase OafA/YrhL
MDYRRPRLPALTGLRFIAALWVVVHHMEIHWRLGLVPTHQFPWQPIYAVLWSGGDAVTAFFVLSGFILAYTYSDGNGRLRGTIRTFLGARFARLYPTYFVYYLFALLPFLWHSPKWSTQDQWQAAGMAITMTQTWLFQFETAINAPAWSLSAEVFFYALFPLLGISLLQQARRHERAVACGLVVLAVALPITVYHLPFTVLGAPDADVAVWRLPVLRLPEFLFGCALCQCHCVILPRSEDIPAEFCFS